MPHKRLLMVIVLLSPCATWALEPFAELVTSEGFSGNVFASILADADAIAAGVPYASLQGGPHLAGAVYVFRRGVGGWSQEAKLFADKPMENDLMGTSVAMQGEVLVAGAPATFVFPDYVGHIYIFRKLGVAWAQQQILLPSISYGNDGFGAAVAIDGDRIVAGAPGDGIQPGRVFVFRWNGSQWAEEGVLTASDVSVEDSFGNVVTIDGDRVLVGVYRHDLPSTDAGAVYVFRYDGNAWAQEVKLTASDTAAGDAFGTAVALRDDLAIIGVPGHGPSGASFGTVCLFRKMPSGWVEENRISASDPQDSSGFGGALDFNGSLLAIGAPGADNGGSGAGSAYLFDSDGLSWAQRAKVGRPDQNANFGARVSVSTTWVGVLSTSNEATVPTSIVLYCVAPIAPCIPAISQWGVLILALLVLVVGCARLRACAAKTACVFLLFLSSVSLAIDPRLASPHHPEQLFVGFKEQTAEPARQTAHLAAGGVLLRSDPYVEGLVLVRIPSRNLAGALDAYTRDANVLYAEPDYLGELFTVPNDTHFSSLWGMHNTGQSGGTIDADIDAPEAWDFWQGDANFRIAVLDTGVHLSHPDLPANIWVNPAECPGGIGTCVANGIDEGGNGYIDDFHGWNYVPPQATWNVQSDYYHGTHMSGIIGAVGNNAVGVTGVNWRCKIVVLKISQPPPNAGIIYVSDAIAALDYVIANQIKVSNNSYGWYAYSQAHYDKIRATRNYVGHIFVAAAGNGGIDGIGDDNDGASPAYPTSYNLNNIIAVAATSRTDALPAFSNYGLTAVDLGAPGVDIFSTMSDDLICCPPADYLEKSGTSMAAAHVTGVVALVRSKWPTWDWSVVKNRVMRTARPTAALSGKCVTGGVVNAFAAMNDCNLNGTPDNQEVAAQTVPDCNANGVPDWCDVTDGLSADCEPDMAPDECQLEVRCCHPGISCGYASLICCTDTGGHEVQLCGQCPLD